VVSRAALRVLGLVVAGCAASSACTAPPDSAADTRPARELPTPSAPAPSSWHAGCIRGGSTPDEVRAAIGEPDSIVQGWWIYGRTQIRFAYGTVQDWVDSSNVVAC